MGTIISALKNDELLLKRDGGDGFVGKWGSVSLLLNKNGNIRMAGMKGIRRGEYVVDQGWINKSDTIHSTFT